MTGSLVYRNYIYQHLCITRSFECGVSDHHHPHVPSHLSFPLLKLYQHSNTMPCLLQFVCANWSTQKVESLLLSINANKCKSKPILNICYSSHLWTGAPKMESLLSSVNANSHKSNFKIELGGVGHCFTWHVWVQRWQLWGVADIFTEHWFSNVIFNSKNRRIHTHTIWKALGIKYTTLLPHSYQKIIGWF